MEVLELVQFRTRAHVAYFTGVTNAPDLRTALVEASRMPDDGPGQTERARLDWAFIDAKMVASKGHLLAAVHLALLLKAQGEMRTKTVHSEILWALCPTNNIADAIKRFGLSPSTTSLLLVKLVPLVPSPPSPSAPDLPPPPRLESDARSLIDGIMTPTSRIASTTDLAAIRKLYKLNGDPALSSLKGRAEEEQEYVDGTVTSLVAAKLVLA